LIAGPLFASVVGASDGEPFHGEGSAVGAGLRHMGIPDDKTLPYENAFSAGNYVVLAHLTPEGKDSVPDIIGHTDPDLFETCQFEPHPEKNRNW
jgi:hypothetical protein